MSVRVRLPANNWAPRWYQLPLWDYFERGGKRGLAVCHRRWGKDDLALNLAAVKAHQRIGGYWHMLPQQAQARKAIWNAVNEDTGKRRIDEAFPHELRESTRDDEMLIRFKCGSTWQVLGSDNYDSLVGSSPVGVVFSEWSLADPRAMSYLRPILIRNGGWTFQIYTARGDNHGLTSYQHALENPFDPVKNPEGWYAVKQTAEETGVFTPEQLAAELAEYIAEHGPDDGKALFEQEYLCSFDAALVGTYYRREINDAEKDGRVGVVPYDPGLPVWVSWDLGRKDQTFLWFAQLGPGGEVRIIDCEAASTVGLDHYAKLIKEKPYVIERHILPHDAEQQKVTILGKQKNAKDVLMGLMGGDERRYTVLPILDRQSGIQAARRLFPRCRFDMKKCADGLSALRSYRKEWDVKRKRFKDEPLHDWASDGADSFRYLALGLPVKYTARTAADRSRYQTGRRPGASGAARPGRGSGWGQ